MASAAAAATDQRERDKDTIYPLAERQGHVAGWGIFFTLVSISPSFVFISFPSRDEICPLDWNTTENVCRHVRVSPIQEAACSSHCLFFISEKVSINDKIERRQCKQKVSKSQSNNINNSDKRNTIERRRKKINREYDEMQNGETKKRMEEQNKRTRRHRLQLRDNPFNLLHNSIESSS